MDAYRELAADKFRAKLADKGYDSIKSTGADLFFHQKYFEDCEFTYDGAQRKSNKNETSFEFEGSVFPKSCKSRSTTWYYPEGSTLEGSNPAV